MVPFFRLDLPDEVFTDIKNVINSGYIGTGSVVNEFEESFVKRFEHSCYCLATNSCTSAIHLALLAANVQRDNIVITTPMTFIGTTLPILYCNAIPLFVDVDPENGLIDIHKVIQTIKNNPSIKAVLIVHLYGKILNLSPLLKFRQESGINFTIIEDFAHATEVKQFQGDFACFSFYPTKAITSGDGGAILTKNPHVYQHIRILSESGLKRNAFERMQTQILGYEIDCIGYKYSMNNLSASMLISQLNYMDKNLARRKDLSKRYLDAFGENSNCDCIINSNKDFCHLFPILLHSKQSRDKLIKHLTAHKIGCAINYPNLLEFAPIISKASDLSKSTYSSEFGGKVLSLPLFSCMTDMEQIEVIDVVNRGIL